MQLMKDHGLVKCPLRASPKHSMTYVRGIIKVIKAESVLVNDFKLHSWGNFVTTLVFFLQGDLEINLTVLTS